MGFLDGLLGVLGDIGSEVLAALQWLFQLLELVFIFIWNTIVLVVNFFFALLKDVGQFFAHVWNNFFKGIFTSVFNTLGKFFGWLKGVIAPVLKWLNAASKYIDRIYRQYVRPFLLMLQRIRQILSIFRALGFKWATKLDGILSTVQHDIQAGFLYVKGVLNTVIDVLNILSDPANLLRKPTTLLSIRRVFHALIRNVTGLPPGFYFPSGSRFAPAGLGPIPAHFDATNPLHNPPASYYLGLDSGVPSLDFMGPGEVPDDTVGDGMSPLDYFAAAGDFPSQCDDPLTCMLQAGKLYSSTGV